METVQNMMMVGPPGAGKTLIARSMPSILPRLTVDEALDITRVYSVADALHIVASRLTSARTVISGRPL
jgi:predicted ATPase with chaperone activity